MLARCLQCEAVLGIFGSWPQLQAALLLSVAATVPQLEDPLPLTGRTEPVDKANQRIEVASSYSVGDGRGHWASVARAVRAVACAPMQPNALDRLGAIIPGWLAWPLSAASTVTALGAVALVFLAAATGSIAAMVWAVVVFAGSGTLWYAADYAQHNRDSFE